MCISSVVVCVSHQGVSYALANMMARALGPVQSMPTSLSSLTSA